MTTYNLIEIPGQYLLITDKNQAFCLREEGYALNSHNFDIEFVTKLNITRLQKEQRWLTIVAHKPLGITTELKNVKLLVNNQKTSDPTKQYSQKDLENFGVYLQNDWVQSANMKQRTKEFIQTLPSQTTLLFTEEDMRNAIRNAIVYGIEQNTHALFKDSLAYENNYIKQIIPVQKIPIAFKLTNRCIDTWEGEFLYD